ncbi:hypothetical protein D3C73_1615560 [compost metagenome]
MPLVGEMLLVVDELVLDEPIVELLRFVEVDLVLGPGDSVAQDGPDKELGRGLPRSRAEQAERLLLKPRDEVDV